MFGAKRVEMDPPRNLASACEKDNEVVVGDRGMWEDGDVKERESEERRRILWEMFFGRSRVEKGEEEEMMVMERRGERESIKCGRRKGGGGGRSGGGGGSSG